MSDILAIVLNDYLEHVAKDTGYKHRVSVNWIVDNSHYEIYFSQPSRADTVYFTPSEEDELIKTVLIVVSVMKGFKNGKEKVFQIPHDLKDDKNATKKED